MKKIFSILSVLLIVFFLFSCATTYYAFDADYNGQKFDGQLSDDELSLKQALLEGAIVIEKFEDRQVENGFRNYKTDLIADGSIISRGPGSGQKGNTIAYRVPGGFKSVTVCWKRTSPKGRLTLWAGIPQLDGAMIYNASYGYGGLIRNNNKTVDSKMKETVSGNFVVDEIRIEGNEVFFYRNNSLYFSYKMPGSYKFDHFNIANDHDGEGLIDYIVIK